MTSAATDRVAPTVDRDSPIHAVGLTKSYGRSTVLDGLDLVVGAGQVVGLLGPNGAGKTTAVKILLGLVTPDAGTARLGGVPAADPRARRQVGYLPERFEYPGWLTAEQVLHAHGRLAGLARADLVQQSIYLLNRVGLGGRGTDRVSGFSKGMQQRLGLAVALLGSPGLVVLDEPTSALDPLGRREVRDIIRAARDDGTAVLLNSHLLGEVEQVCDHVTIMNHGRVLHSGPISELAVGSEVRLTLDRIDPSISAVIQGFGTILATDRTTVLAGLDEAGAVPELVAALVSRGVGIQAVVPLQRSLEDVFVELIDREDGAP